MRPKVDNTQLLKEIKMKEKENAVAGAGNRMKE